MAITTKDQTVRVVSDYASLAGKRFAVNATSPDVTAGEIIKAAPSASGSLVIQKMKIQVVGNVTTWLGERLTDSATGTVTRLIGPIKCDADIPVSNDVPLAYPIKLPDGFDLVIDSSGAASAWVYVEGFTIT